MRLTIRDVSETAGVSIKTVSRVLNKERYVREETRLKVEAAIEQLGFRPSAAARALAGKRSFQIALLYDNENAYYVFDLLAGARRCCLENGFRLIFQPCDIHSPRLLDDVRALIDETHLDGIILPPPLADVAALIDELHRRDVAFVRISPGTEPDASSSVFIDDRAAAEAMTARLIALGHRRIGFVLGHPDHASTADRVEGYRAALVAHGIAEDPAIIQPGRYDFESGRVAGAALLDLSEPPTAIFASNDEMAAGVLAVAHERDIAVPETLSIAGFDDTTLCRLVWPPLTTVHQPSQDLAYFATALLIDGQAEIRRRKLAFAVIERGSTAPVAG
ncbi:LacI family DNA-binding transcriptional regulator [Sphingomonas sp. LaA6.9]|uniref:LacI family DNA-binding transcriptional regulator n=1 Tax=Sphingomonas sp. LaA6.9 TaxID=2919914 RepID=UPI001F4F3B01|nr:LacI family DNA-binding transcriptional regulator [Sphingomonas sp. LaA6.9]MCJ8158287.1 LacI family DNA-binding transcriptional regulator [Sphingomonas sp. LaA6.9]